MCAVHHAQGVTVLPTEFFWLSGVRPFVGVSQRQRHRDQQSRR